MKTSLIEKKGVLIASENSAKLYLVVGEWDKVSKSNTYEWWMVSSKTGKNMIKTPTDQMSEIVKAHWSGFVINQN